MYIPRVTDSAPAANPADPDHGLRAGQQLFRDFAGPILDSVLPSIRPVFFRALDAAPTADNGAPPRLHRRESAQQNAAMIGAVVGVLLSVFIIGSCAFLYYYRDSIRHAQQKRIRRRRKSRGSKSSKGSKGVEPPPAA